MYFIYNNPDLIHLNTLDPDQLAFDEAIWS